MQNQYPPPGGQWYPPGYAQTYAAAPPMPPPPPPRKARVWPFVAVPVAAMVLIGAVIGIVAGASGDDDKSEGSGATVVEEVATSPAGPPAPEPSPAAPELGTRSNPVPVGTTIEVADWNVAVTGVTLDAGGAVAAENPFNEPPAPGRQFVMFTVEMNYIGAESGQAADLDWSVVGARGTTFGQTSMDNYCGVIPNPLDEYAEIFSGGVVTGNMCFAVAADQVSGGTVMVEDFVSFGDDADRSFIALG